MPDTERNRWTNWFIENHDEIKAEGGALWDGWLEFGEYDGTTARLQPITEFIIRRELKARQKVGMSPPRGWDYSIHQGGRNDQVKVTIYWGAALHGMYAEAHGQFELEAMMRGYRSAVEAYDQEMSRREYNDEES